MAYNAGQALLQIVPSFQSVAEQIDAEAAKWGESAGTTFADSFAQAAKEGVSDAIPNQDADATEKGESAGGKFADAFKARVDEAIRSLPDASIDLNSTGFDLQIDKIRAELEELSNQRIGIDISDDEAMAKLLELKAQLDDIAASSPSVSIRTNAAQASAEVAAFQAEVAGADGALGGLGDDAAGAGGGVGALGGDAEASSGAIGALIPALAALAAALIPIAGLAGGALAAIPGILAGAGAGFGALKLGLGGIGNALTAYSTEQNKAAKATGGSASAASSAASQAVSNAQTVRNAANSVAQAEESLANAQQSATDSVRQANEQLEASELSLADAEFSEQQAQQALTQARIDAQNALTNYQDQLADGSLAIQQAQQDITTAQTGITAVGPGTTGTAAQQAQAQLTYEEAVQRLKDLEDQQAQLQQTAATANAAGVDGAQGVVQAQHQLLDAQNAVGTAQQSQADTQIALSEAQSSAVQKVTDAQNALTNALLNQQTALQQIALQPAGGGGGGGAAAPVNTFAAAMAKLTPQGRDFVNFLIGLENQFNKLGRAVQAILLPGLETGLASAILPNFGQLSLYIENAASGIGDLATKFGQFLGSTKGVSEINSVLSQGAGFMRQLGGAAVTLFEAFLSIGSQAAPIVSAIGSGITNLVDAFANWAENGGFQRFLGWLRDNGPSIVSDVSNIFKGFVGFLIAVEPIGKALLDVAGAIGKIVALAAPVLRFLSEGAIFLFRWFNPIGQLIEGIDLLKDNWQHAWSDISHWAEDAFDHVKSAVFDPIIHFFSGGGSGGGGGGGTATVTSIPGAMDATVGFFTALPARISSALGDFVGIVFGPLIRVASWLDSNVWGPLSAWFIGIPTRVAQAIGDFFTAAFADLKTVGTWLESNVGAPAFNWFITLPVRVAQSLSGFLGTAFSALAGVGSWLESNVWTPISSFFSGLGSRIATVASGMWDGIANAFIGAINAVINVWDGLHFTVGGGSFAGISIPSFTLGVPHIPDISQIGTRAAGGDVEAGASYVVGERGMELFSPEVDGHITSNSDLAGLLSGLSGGSNAPVGSSPAVAIDEAHFHDEADLDGLMRQAYFRRTASKGR